MRLHPITLIRRLMLCAGTLTGLSVIAHTLDPILTNPPNLPRPQGYSHIAIVPAGSELIMLSGQIGDDAAGKLPDDIGAQYRNAAANVLALLGAQGIPLRNVVKMNTYVVASADTAPLRGVHTALDDIVPTATLLYVSRLAHPQAKIEIEVFASRAPGSPTPQLIPPRDFGQ